MLGIFRRIRVVAEAVLVADAVIAVVYHELRPVGPSKLTPLFDRRPLRVVQAGCARILLAFDCPTAIRAMGDVDVFLHAGTILPGFGACQEKQD